MMVMKKNSWEYYVALDSRLYVDRSYDKKKSLICINNNNNVSYICIFIYRGMSYYHITKKM